MTQEQKLTEERLGLIAKQREMNDRLIEEGRDFNSEEKVAYDKMEADANALKAKVDRMVALKSAQQEIEKPTTQGVRAMLDGTPKGGPRATAEYVVAFRSWMQHGDGSTPMEVKNTLQKAPGATGGGGANVLVPLEYETRIVELLTDANIIRKLATVTTTSKDQHIPIETALPTFGWIGELGTFPTTQGAFSAKVFSAWKMGGIIQISEELMDDADIDMGELIARRGALAAGLTEEAAFIAGDGNQKPTGITVEATGTYTTAAPTAMTFDDLIAAFFKVPRFYRESPGFAIVLADAAVSSLRTAKNAQGAYYWQPAVTAGEPDRILGKPFYTSDFLAASGQPALGAGLVSGFMGDISQYQVLDRRGWAVQQLRELYAATGQIGFRMWSRVDGHLLRPDSVVVITQHA